MTTDLEADLRREFDTASPPSSLTFSPESVLRQGSRTIRRRRIISGGSAAMAVALVAVGASLLTRPHDTALPQPATRTATTGIVTSAGGDKAGTFDVEFNRDARATPNVHYFFRPADGQRQEIGTSSSAKPGEKPDAIWRSGIVDGHPVTMGLVPATVPNLAITFTGGVGSSDGVMSGDLEGTGYSWFAVSYPDGATGPADIASIRWSGPTGIVDGIEGDHRLTGRVLTMSNDLSVEVALRPIDGGRFEVLGQTITRVDGHGASSALDAATTDPSGVAVATGRQPVARTNTLGQDVYSNVGPPVAAGILPAGSSGIGVMLTTGAATSPIVVLETLPDGRVIFAVRAQSAKPSDPSPDSIKAVTWTNADGTQGRKEVTQGPA